MLFFEGDAIAFPESGDRREVFESSVNELKDRISRIGRSQRSFLMICEGLGRSHSEIRAIAVQFFNDL